MAQTDYPFACQAHPHGRAHHRKWELGLKGLTVGLHVTVQLQASDEMQCMCVQWALAPSLQPWMRGIFALAALANGCALLRAAGKIPGSDFDKGVVKAAIEGSMGPIGMGLLLTAMTA